MEYLDIILGLQLNSHVTILMDDTSHLYDEIRRLTIDII